MFQSYGLERNVFKPTHISGGSLDQIFTFLMQQQQQQQLQCTNTFVDSSRSLASDHFPVCRNLTIEFEKKYFKDTSYSKLSNIDQPTFNSELKYAHK